MDSGARKLLLAAPLHARVARMGVRVGVQDERARAGLEGGKGLEGVDVSKGYTVGVQTGA